MARDSTSASALSRPVSGNEPRSQADDNGEGEQVHLVDKVIVEQPPEQGAAAVHLQLASRPGFQLANRGDDATGENESCSPSAGR